MKKRLLATILTGAIAIALLPTAVMAKEENEDKRPSYTTEEVNAGILGNEIVLNSISDNQIGDEQNFLHVAVTGTDEYAWHGNTVNVEEERVVYLVRLYVHNDNPGGEAVVSENTRVSVTMPESFGKELRINATITSDNATPGEYHDDVTFVSDHNFTLDYVYGSAQIVNNWTSKNEQLLLSDDIIKNGSSVLIGHDTLDGRLPGGTEYEQFICFKVVATLHHECEMATKVRLKGTDEWQDEVQAKVGDEVEYQVRFTNTDSEAIRDVAFFCVNDPCLEYAANTAVYHTTSHPEPISVEQADDLFQPGGANLGNCPSDSEIILTYAAKVADADLEVGNNALVSWTQTILGEERYQKYAIVHVWRKSKVATAVLTISYIVLAALVVDLIRVTRLIRLYRKHRKG